MRSFSAEHPEYIFQLDGEGEESGDVWRAYFYAGKFKRHKVVIAFPPFSFTDLI